jgi:hypothetical protein
MIALLTLAFPVAGDMQLPTYQVGDQWVYSVNLNLEGMVVISGDWTFEVEDEILVSGHEAYDVSLDGAGSASLSGLGTGSYTMEGFTSIRKSDLATIEERMMIDITTTIVSQEIHILAYMNASYNPSLNVFDFPVKEGDTWTSTSTTTIELVILSDNPLVPTTDTSITEVMTSDFTCESKETVEVPAGKFASYKIKMTDSSGNKTYDYVSTKAGYIVKTQMYNSTGASVGNLNLKSYSYTPPAAGNGDDLISNIMDYLWLLILLIIVVIVLIVLGVVLSKRSKGQEPSPDEPPPDEETNK